MIEYIDRRGWKTGPKKLEIGRKRMKRRGYAESKESKSSEMKTVQQEPRAVQVGYEQKSLLFLVLAVITLNLTLAVVLICYMAMKLKIQQGEYTGTAEAAFIIGVPFLLAAILFGLLSWLFHRRGKERREAEGRKADRQKE